MHKSPKLVKLDWPKIRALEKSHWYMLYAFKVNRSARKKRYTILQTLVTIFQVNPLLGIPEVGQGKVTGSNMSRSFLLGQKGQSVPCSLSHISGFLHVTWN